ncbi:MAG: hypothetical protein ACRDIV_17655 [Ktedonobacteraceae bacterium]
MSTQHKSRLDRELDTLLEHLGVQREMQDAPSQQDLHITCLSSNEDRLLWKEIQKHLALVKHPTGGAIHWHAHEVDATSRLATWQTKRIQERLGQTHLILLFVSIDLLAALSGKAEEINRAIIETIRQEQPPKFIVVAARPTAWYDDYIVDLPRSPRKGTLTTMRPAERGYVEVARAVQQAINDLCHSF